MKDQANIPNKTGKRPWTFGRVFGTMVSGIFKTILYLILIVILTPPVYFAWRATLPMELPAFGGKTFYQVQAERQQEYAENEFHWQLTHHGEYPMKYKGMCYHFEVVYLVLVVKPLMDYVLVRHILTPKDPYTSLPANVHYQGILDYLPASWTLFEMVTLSLYQYIPHDFNAAYGPYHGACIIPPPNGK